MNLETKIDKVYKTPQALDFENITISRMKSLVNMLTWHYLIYHFINYT